MPFDFKAYDAKCSAMNPEELQREWEHYTRLISGASTSTAVSGMAVPFTLGVSLIGVGMAAPAIHNARKKREIIEAHLRRHGTTHHTRKRDVLGSMAVSGTIGVVTLGVGSAGADMITTAGAEHGISAVVANETAIKVVTHAALDGAGMGVEHVHTSHLKKKDAHKAFVAAGTFQAVADAKAREAGYSAQGYNPQTYAFGPGSSSGSMAQGQPPYGYNPGDQTWVQPPPSYSASTAPAVVSDSKAPVVYAQNVQGGSGQQYTAQQYGPSQPQYQQYQQYQNYEQTGGSSSSAAVPEPQNPNPTGQGYGPTVDYANSGVVSAQQQPPNQYQQQGQEQANQQPQFQIPQTPAPSYTPGPAYGAYEMKAMVESLPVPTPAPEQQQQQQQQQYPNPTIQAPQPGYQGQDHARSQSISQQAEPTQQYTVPPIQPANTGASDSSGPVLYSPQPTTVYNPTATFAEYGTQPTPTPAPQQFSQDYSQQPAQAQQQPQAPQQQYQQTAQQYSNPVQQQGQQQQPQHQTGTTPYSGQTQSQPPQSSYPTPSYTPAPSYHESPTPAPQQCLAAPTPAAAAAYSSPPPQDIQTQSNFPPPPPASNNPPAEFNRKYGTSESQQHYGPAAVQRQGSISTYQTPYQAPQQQQQQYQQYQYQPQQHQQQSFPQQLAYTLPPTPLSLPSSPPTIQPTPTNSSYFPAPARTNAQDQCNYQQQQQQQWNGQQQPGMQAPYTPAATPASQYTPQAHVQQGYPPPPPGPPPQQQQQQQQYGNGSGGGKAAEANAAWYAGPGTGYYGTA